MNLLLSLITASITLFYVSVDFYRVTENSHGEYPQTFSSTYSNGLCDGCAGDYILNANGCIDTVATYFVVGDLIQFVLDSTQCFPKYPFYLTDSRQIEYQDNDKIVFKVLNYDSPDIDSLKLTYEKMP